jgi:hypothetical protein
MKKVKKAVEIYIDEEIDEKRLKIAHLLKEAVSSVRAPDADLMEALRKISRYYEEESGCYPVLAISKDDIRREGFNPDRLSAEEMRSYENEFSEDLSIMDAYWDIVERVSRDLGLPGLRTETGRIYEEYKKTNGREPLYATIWLEDRGYNNLPRPETVKLSLDVDESEDEQVYMNFREYADMKEWLYSTLEDDSESEDAWCYETPEHRIEFFDKLT